MLKQERQKRQELNSVLRDIRRDDRNKKQPSQTSEELPQLFAQSSSCQRPKRLPIELFENATKIGTQREFQEFIILDIEDDPTDKGIFHFSIILKNRLLSERQPHGLHPHALHEPPRRFFWYV